MDEEQQSRRHDSEEHSSTDELRSRQEQVPEPEETEAEVLEAFARVEQGGDRQRGLPIYAVIPEEVIHSSPAEFTAFLESIFTEDALLEEALDLVLDPQTGSTGKAKQTVRAVVPSRVLRSQSFNPAELLDELFAAFYEIDETLQSLQEMGGPGGEHLFGLATHAVVPESVIADPEALARAIDEADDSRVKLNLLLQQARQVLRRLDVYRLSKRKPHEVIEEMSQAGDLGALQYLVDFLHSIHTAAESFESLELPRYHIRDYLKHLYLMEDWQSMTALVQRLERAVQRYTRIAGGDQLAGPPSR